MLRRVSESDFPRRLYRSPLSPQPGLSSRIYTVDTHTHTQSHFIDINERASYETRTDNVRVAARVVTFRAPWALFFFFIITFARGVRRLGIKKFGASVFERFRAVVPRRSKATTKSAGFVHQNAGALLPINLYNARAIREMFVLVKRNSKRP